METKIILGRMKRPLQDVFTSSYFLNKIRLNKYRIYRYVNHLTRGNLKCPKNYVKDIFCTWWHMICICLWNVPFSFSCLKSDHAFFLEMPHFYYDRKSCNPPFSNHSKKFWFKNRGISKSDNIKKRGTETVRFWGILKTNAYVITWKICPIHTFLGIPSYLP